MAKIRSPKFWVLLAALYWWMPSILFFFTGYSPRW